MPLSVPKKAPFAAKKVIALRAFDGGLNNKFSPLLIDDKELVDIQNLNFDEKGSLTKRKGYLKHYASNFDGNPARDSYNYRRGDGTSRLIIAASDKLYSDQPQFLHLYTLKADWEAVGVQMSGVNASQVSGDIVLTSRGMLGQMLLGAASALLGGNSGTTRSGTWQSDAINISAVTNQTSGVIAINQIVPASTTVLVETRTSPDGSAWAAYTALGPGNTIASAANDFLQVRVTMTSTVSASPSVQSLQITFDTTATVSVLASGLSTIARYTLATQNDNVYITNGVNVMSKWDGTTYTATSPGSPPTAKYVFVHKNLMFLAGNSVNPSRLYFSALADPESWPALNFIDVGRGDGDTITGLAVLLDRLVIFKNNSVWLLEGDSSSNFVLRRASSQAGCVDQHSVVEVNNTLGFMARDGFYFFDGVRVQLASEKISATVAALNESQFGLVAAVHYPNIRKVLVALPGSGMTFNDTVLVFDTQRAAWTVYKGINAASWVIWRQFSVDHLLFGSSTTGQLYDAETGYSDDGAAIACYAVTKALDLGGTELSKYIIDSFVTAKETSGTGNATVNVSFFVDLATTETSAAAATVSSATVNVKRNFPATVGAGTVRDIAIKVAETSANRSVTLYGLGLELTPRFGIRQT